MTPEEMQAARKRLGLNRCQLAEKLGVHQTSYGDYEFGTRNPRRSVLMLLGNLLKEADERDAKTQEEPT